jgi:heme exporter protein C
MAHPPAAQHATTGTRFTRGLGIVTLIGVAWLVFFGLFVSPEDVVQRSSVRMMYIHVPSAWLAYLAFIMSAVGSAAYLWKRTRSLTWDRIAGASAEVGVLFMGITLVSGSMWGRLSWDKYWVWDARLTSTAFLFVTFIGYLAVRNLGGTPDQRAKRSAIVALLGVLEIPLVHFSVKLWRSVHQDSSIADRGTDVKMNGLMLFTLFVGIIAFTLMYVWLLLHRQRSLAMQDAMAARGLDLAIAERRTDPPKATTGPATA